MISFSFIIVVLLSILFFYFGTGKDKRATFLFLAWQTIIGVAVLKGIFRQSPEFFPVAIIGTMILSILWLKHVDRQKMDLRMLLAVHILRIPVELILYQLFLQHKIPEQMTFKGWNPDILMGISALFLLLYTAFGRGQLNKIFFIAWNVAGIFALAFIVSIAILSSPLPIQQFAFEQPNIAVLQIPYCFLPTCIVPVVLMSHILLMTKQPSRQRFR